MPTPRQLNRSPRSLRLTRSEDAAAKYQDTASPTSGAKHIRPGAYQQAPGQDARRNESIRNSLSAQMSNRNLCQNLSEGSNHPGRNLMSVPTSSSNSQSRSSSDVHRDDDDDDTVSTISATSAQNRRSKYFNRRGESSGSNKSFDRYSSGSYRQDTTQKTDDDGDAEALYNRKIAASLVVSSSIRNESTSDKAKPPPNTTYTPKQQRHRTIRPLRSKSPERPRPPPLLVMDSDEKKYAGKESVLSSASQMSGLTNDEKSHNHPLESSMFISTVSKRSDKSNEGKLLDGADAPQAFKVQGEEKEEIESDSEDDHHGDDGIGELPGSSGHLVNSSGNHQSRQFPIKSLDATRRASNCTVNWVVQSSNGRWSIARSSGSSALNRSGSDEFSSDFAKNSAGRVARNMSILAMSSLMRRSTLPVAATVADNEEAQVAQLREQLECEIRQELEIEMEQFRRQLVLQVVSTAEPVTADVISMSSQQREEYNVSEAQYQREREEAAALRSNLNQNLGRMWINMKKQHIRSSHMNDPEDGVQEVFTDESEALVKEGKKGAVSWDIWAIFVLVLIFCILLGAGMVLLFYM